MLVPGTLHQPSSEIFALIDQVICKGLNGFIIEICWAVESVDILKSGWCRLCYHHYKEIKTFKECHIEWFLIHDDKFQNLHTDMCQGLCSGHCLWAGDRDQMASYFTKASKRNYPKILQNVDERRDLIQDLQLYDSIHDSIIWPSKELHKLSTTWRSCLQESSAKALPKVGYPCPVGFNPADFVIFIMQTDIRMHFANFAAFMTHTCGLIDRM